MISFGNLPHLHDRSLVVDVSPRSVFSNSSTGRSTLTRRLQGVMVPVPRRQNPQHQPLTVSLRKICGDYPAGAGVLRELLQNADDAGASTVVHADPYHPGFHRLS